MAVHVVWYKRDLRVVDHAPLTEAARRGPVLPLYIVEPDLWQQPDTSARHWAFIRESLIELRQSLAESGQPLVVRTGAATAVLSAIHDRHGIDGLWSHQETGGAWTYRRDRDVAAWARDHAIAWSELPQHGVVRGLRSRDGWARQWERLMARRMVPRPAGLAPLPDIDPGPIPPGPIETNSGPAPDPCPLRQPGGRTAGRALLDSFLDSRGARYHKEMSSPNAAFDSCSRLSPHFAWGTVSIREAAQAARTRLDAVRSLSPAERGTWPAALSAFVGRLHWHCHFIQKLESEPRLEVENQHRAYDGLRPEAPDPHILGAWSRGETGWPFLDACMRALAATGWINFRMRAMLMAVSSYQLWQPWRPASLHLARLFTDYEPGIHYPQSQMQSGTTGINTVRIYNPIKQSRDQDPDGRFIRRWVPALACVADRFVHEPWRMDTAEQRRTGCVIGADYPAPIVDHVAAAKTARTKVWSVRRGDGYRAEAGAIQERHGSRKSGLPPSNPSRRKPRDEGQGELPL